MSTADMYRGQVDQEETRWLAQTVEQEVVDQEDQAPGWWLDPLGKCPPPAGADDGARQ